jgi:hypothetical protein
MVRGNIARLLALKSTSKDSGFDAKFLNPTVYGFLEARVDFDWSRSTC